MNCARPSRLHASLLLGFGRSFNSTVLSALVVIAFLALPVTAFAGASDSRKSPGTSAEFTVAGTNGYSLYVKSEGGVVSVAVANELPMVDTISAAGRIRPANTGNVATSTYLTNGSPRDPNTIEADLGPFGRISVAFQPSGQTHVNRVNLKDKSRKCVGAERIVRHLGTFTGTIEFEGEGGYTTANVSSAAGTVGTSLFRNCTTKVGRASASTASSSQSSTSLIATNPPSFFAAFAESNSPVVGFFASVPESASQQVILLRMAQAVALCHWSIHRSTPGSLTVTRGDTTPYQLRTG